MLSVKPVSSLGIIEKRRKASAQFSEFTAALILLIFGIVVPLLDLGAVPLHWLLSQEIITSEARNLAESDNFSSAIANLDSNSAMRTKLNNLGGVKIVSVQCVLVISQLNDPFEMLVVEEPKKIPLAWLPGGAKSPCRYELELRTVLELRPLIMLDGIKTAVPGLTKPFNCIINQRSHWENYGRNAATKQFYMNE